MRWLFARAYAPLFFFGFIGLATWLVQAGHPPAWLLAILLAAVFVSHLAEAWLPYRRAWNRPRRDRLRDLAHALVNESLGLLGLASIPLLAAASPWAGYWPRHWPLGLQLGLAILVADFGITLLHYLSHRWAPLWRLHAVHHSIRRLYGFNGLMKHPLHQVLEALAGTAPLVLLGIPVDVAALLALAVGIQLLLQHSNVDMRIGPLRLLFAWAPLHRLHHLRYGRAGDVNFALFFSAWDRLLDTALYLPDYRVGSRDLGIGDRPDYPDAYLAQLCEPFRQVPGAPMPPLPERLRRALGQQVQA